MALFSLSRHYRPFRTEGIYRTYAITDEAMLREGAAKLAALHQQQRDSLPAPKVVSGAFGSGATKPSGKVDRWSG